MTFVNHPLIKPDSIESRTYQETILGTASNKNTLCVIPTGLGKTTLAIMLAALRLEKYPNSKILIMAPTKPLCEQHQKSFQEFMNIPEEEIVLVTGEITPKKRKDLYEFAQVVAATPQTIQNDIRNDIIDLYEFSLLVVDECHRSVKKYAYPFVVKNYVGKSKYPRVLGLTASPGSEEAKIRRLCDNLFVDSVEIRTDADEDVKPYIKEIETEYVKVDLPDNLKSAQDSLKRALKTKLEKLKKYNIYVNNKRDLLESQKKVSRQIATSKKPILFYMISLIVQAIKIWHTLELMETQSVKAVRIYIQKVKGEKTKSDTAVLKDPDFRKAISIIEESDEHPKIRKLQEVIENEIDNNKAARIIIFSHFRDNIQNIYETLENVCKPAILIGQSGERGLSQKEQIEVIRDFNDGYYNCLITSPIGEEGLHIPSADIAIFYDSVASEIRTIQRRGRVGRTKVGKIIFLLTKKTRDEGYYWTSQRRENRMKTILKRMQKDKNTLNDFID